MDPVHQDERLRAARNLAAGPAAIPAALLSPKRAGAGVELERAVIIGVLHRSPQRSGGVWTNTPVYVI